MTDQRNQTIDVAKLCAAFLVVGIHINLFVDCNEQLHFLFTGLMCRMAVPFFALCTGYYLADKETFIPQWKKLIKLYLLWSFIYLLWLQINWVDTGYISANAYIGYFKSMLLTGSYFHLWYVLYIIYALPIYWLIKRFLPVKYWIILSIILYTCTAIQYGYSQWLPGSINAILSIIGKCYALSHAQFQFLPMLLAGGYLKRHGIPTKKTSILLLITTIVLLIIEGEILYHHGLKLVSYVLMILPTAASIFCVLQHVSLHSFPLKRCGELSLLIYCIHPIFCYYINESFNCTVIEWGLVCTICLVLASAWLEVLNTIHHE